MELGLKGKRAVLMASSRGLGLGIGRALVHEGVDVLLMGRDETQLATAKARLNSAGLGRCCTLCADQTQPDWDQRVKYAVSMHLGSADILLLNSGGPDMGNALEVGDNTWRASFEAMVLAPIRLARVLVPEMKARRWGRVLAITASSVAQPIPALAVSNTMRAALTNWLKTLASEVAADGVTVNTIVPGRILTDRVDFLDRSAAARLGVPSEDVHRAAVSAIPAGRDGTSEEFASAAVFLASAAASYITGSAIRVDGGMIRSPMS